MSVTPVSDLFVPLDDHPAYRQIANLIEQRIVERTLRTGDALPSETDLARQFGVNRSTIREAIRELEIHGLLGRERGEKRLRVTRPEPRRVSSGVSRALALHDVTFMELWEAMMAIEPAAAQYAASRRTAAQGLHGRSEAAHELVIIVGIQNVVLAVVLGLRHQIGIPEALGEITPRALAFRAAAIGIAAPIEIDVGEVGAVAPAALVHQGL